jgi:uncharacterized protein (DUF1501 family)
MFGTGAAPAWLAHAAGQADPTRRPKVLVTVFQRGAMDGLNVLVPHGDANYYRLRPTIAVPRSDVIDLDGFYGLHPVLASLKPIWDARELALVEAVGSPDSTRSHFDAQDYMESGTPGRKATPDGWLNRAIPRGRQSPVRALAVGPQLPRSLRGSEPAIAVKSLREFQVRGSGAAASFEQLYDSAVDRVLASSGQETFDAIRLLQQLSARSNPPDGYPRNRFGQAMSEIAQVIKADVGLQVAFADMGGWDTHVNEMGARPEQGQLANLLRDFGGTLAAFRRDLGDRMEDVVVVTMSEFGRTARENGNRGTDHGHANIMMVIGGAVRGGKIYGDWPGLEPEQLHQGRDLALTTDFRDVLSEVVSKHLRTSDLSRVFPGYARSNGRGLFT